MNNLVEIDKDCWHADNADALGNADFRRFLKDLITEFIKFILVQN